ncbi:MAG: hypothetical protein U9N85_14130 [Bacteroidota bacterium]|nr:hypothetical protein [Bacteroidota bacterium]
MKTKILQISSKIFDKLYKAYESPKGFKFISTGLVFVFVSSLVLTQLNNWFEFSASVSKFMPTNYFDAVEITFHLLLAVEILGMVFVLAYSVSKSVAKQFEILALILLRSAFKEFSKYDIISHWDTALTPVSYMLSDAFGALIIFVGVFYYLKIQKHQKITCTYETGNRYTAVKKMLALIMIVVFASIAVYDLGFYFSTGNQLEFFHIFYTILIFTDILLVIISLRYNHSFAVVFRNSALAVAVVFIRIALSAPPYFNAGIGALSLGFVILTGIYYNKFRAVHESEEGNLQE